MEGNAAGEPGRVLLASVSNMMYPVDLDLIHHLFSRFGEVEKALVQFARPDQARTALANLHNRNIYDGCNTLQIQESRLPELVVKSNCAKSWDYTQCADGPGAAGASIMEHPQQHMHSDMHHQVAVRGMYSPYGGVRAVTQPPFCLPPERLPQELREIDFDAANPSQTPVIIVYNIPTPVTIQMVINDETQKATYADSIKMEIKIPLLPSQSHLPPPVFFSFSLQLFNLFSLYGIVLRIKILKERPDTALIQYSVPFYATIAQCLMMVTLSRNKEVRLPPASITATSDSAGFEDEKRTVAFTMKDQRYGGEDMEKYVKGACRPTKTVFVANVHEDATADEVSALFKRFGAVLKFTFKKPKNEASKTKLCIMELESEERALSAIMHLHNHELMGRYLKVAFSKSII
ncbi:hypothetical protein ACSSS7_002300 [Eimeria intestinalis]